MKEIISRGNHTIKELKKLQQKKFRYQQRAFMVENIVTVKDAWQVSGVKPRVLFVTASVLSHHPWLEEVTKGGDIFVITPEVNEVASELDTPTGLVAVYDFIEHELDWETNFVYLNKVADPGNLGTILRSAAAFGIKNIVLDKGCVDLYNAKVIQAAKNAIFLCNFGFDQGNLWAELKSKMPVVTSIVTGGGGINFNTAGPICLLIGSESHGADKELVEQADHTISIPTSGAIESLNVGVAASILFYELYKKNKD
ncbi:MAG: RNA methyltransferase [Candidatus Komeilibacteria bacterium]|nr:RNA methyltransferase [Candidatus Komeilibacteria bacterium]